MAVQLLQSCESYAAKSTQESDEVSVMRFKEYTCDSDRAQRSHYMALLQMLRLRLQIQDSGGVRQEDSKASRSQTRDQTALEHWRTQRTK